MRPGLLALLCVMLAIPFADGWAQARGQPGRTPAPPRDPQREMTLSNRAGQAITEFYASPSSTDDWGDNRLPQGPVPPGKQQRLRLGATRECEWDFQAVYEDGAREESRGTDLCRSPQVAFDGSKAERPAAGEERSLVLENRSTRRIDEVYLSPSDADRWDDDRLPTTLPPGDSAAISYRGGCTADLRIVYETRAAEERREINVCELGKVVVAPGWVLADDPSKAAAPADAGPAAPAPASPPAPGPSADIPKDPSPAPSPTPPTPSPAPAAAADTISIQNRSGAQVVELYVYPDGAARGTDRLGLAVLADGDARAVPLDRGAGCDKTTVHAVFGGQRPDLDKRGMDLCTARTLTLQAADAAPGN